MKVFSSGDAGLTRRVYSVAAMRELDAAAVTHYLPGIQLMARAAGAALALLLEKFPAPGLITVYCGTGKNAGDGYLLAKLATRQQLQVQVFQVGCEDKLCGEALLARQEALQAGVAVAPFASHRLPATGVLVDALLGIGVKGEPDEAFSAAIQQINGAGLPVVALDVPSGLNADTGAAAGAAVAAGITVSFLGLKRGLLTGRGPALCGDLYVCGLELPAELIVAHPGWTPRLDLDDCLQSLPPRAADAHKGNFGHVMVIGGDIGYGGAALMAAEAAARVGAGLISVATRPEHVAALLARRPEVMACGVVSGQELEPLLERPDVLVIGPGLGRSPWSEQMLQQALKTGLPMVVDADALNMMAEGRVVPEGVRRDNWILTPHPGEAARLLGIDTATVQQHRYHQARLLQQRYGGALILKGAGSLVVNTNGEVGVVTAGNPGMASGGMGDILSGLLGGLLAQGLSVADAAALGVCLHAVAADLAADVTGERSLLATDLLPWVCELLQTN